MISQEETTALASPKIVTIENYLEFVTVFVAIAIIVVFVIVATRYGRAVWRWMWMAEEQRDADRERSPAPGGTNAGGTNAGGTNAGGTNAGGAPASAPLAYRLLVLAVVSVTVLFVVTMLLFWAARNANNTVLFDDPAQVIAALSLVFTVIGTLVGTYFGVKTGGDAQRTATHVAQAAAQTAADTADRAADRAAGALRDSLSSSGTYGTDSLSVVSALHSAWNAGTQENQEAVVGFFADSAVVSLVATDRTESYEGKERIRGFVQDYMPGCRVDSRNHRLVGTGVAWESTVTWVLADASAKVRTEKAGNQVDGTFQADGTVVTVFEGNKIKSLTFSLSPASQPVVQETGGQAEREQEEDSRQAEGET